MGSINQLEKLHKLLALFQSTPDSLERVVACERINNTIKKTEELINQRSFLREERRQVRLLAEEVEHKKRILIQLKQVNWSSASVSHPIDTGTLGVATTPKDKDKNRRVKFSLGGLLFESPVATLTKDSTSLLAQLCNKDISPMEPNKDGYYCFDRDWWLFRHILNFLRDGNLPEDRKLLAQLYKEASFWNLKSLQRAIEEQKLQLIVAPSIPNAAAANANGSITSTVAAIGLSSNILDPLPVTSVVALASKEWWRSQPSWWYEREKQLAADKSKADKEAADKLAAEQANKPGDKDWWTGGSYNGRTFLPMPPSLVTATAAPVSAAPELIRRPITPGGRIAAAVAAATAPAPVSVPVSAPPLILSSIFPSNKELLKPSGSSSVSGQGRAYAYGSLPSSSSTYLPPDSSEEFVQSSSQYQYRSAPSSSSSPAAQVNSLKEYMRQHNLGRHSNHPTSGNMGARSGAAEASSAESIHSRRGKENAGASQYNYPATSGHMSKTTAEDTLRYVDSSARASAPTASSRTGGSYSRGHSTEALHPPLTSLAPAGGAVDDDYRLLDREIELELEAAKMNSRNKIAAASAAVSTLDREMAELLHSYIKVTNDSDSHDRSLMDH